MHPSHPWSTVSTLVCAILIACNVPSANEETLGSGPESSETGAGSTGTASVDGDATETQDMAESETGTGPDEEGSSSDVDADSSTSDPGGSTVGSSDSGTTSTVTSGTDTETGMEGSDTGADGSETYDTDADPTDPELPDPGPEGDGDYELGPNYMTQPALTDLGAPKGQRFQFTMRLRDSEIFDGTDATLDPNKPVNETRRISVYVPARYQDGTAAPVLVIQDGDGPLDLVSNALDNLTISDDPEQRIPPFIAVAVQNGGNDAQGSERGLEYDTLSDRYARFIDQEVLPAVVEDAGVRAAYPNLHFTSNPSGRATLGCSSGGAAAFTMAWFRPDLFARVIAYSTTLVDQQNHAAAEYAIYPHGAWDYHSELELIANAERKPLRIFLNVNENDLRAGDPESTHHNWVMANQRTAAALAAKDYHYRFVYGLDAGHCAGEVQRASLADALVWVWRGYEGDGSSGP